MASTYEPQRRHQPSQPTARRVVTSLIDSISTKLATSGSQSLNPLSNADPETRNFFLTLHSIFPNDFLPALDLLDRGLVTRFTVSRKDSSGDELSTGIGAKKSPQHVYYVQSAQQRNSRPSRYRGGAIENTTHYEVRPQAWSCSCPAFAFSAFPAAAESISIKASNSEQTPLSEGQAGWSFGGLTRGSELAICKHLFACILVEHCSAFSHLAEKEEASPEELAGWAAGWGD